MRRMTRVRLWIVERSRHRGCAIVQQRSLSACVLVYGAACNILMIRLSIHLHTDRTLMPFRINFIKPCQPWGEDSIQSVFVRRSVRACHDDSEWNPLIDDVRVRKGRMNNTLSIPTKTNTITHTHFALSSLPLLPEITANGPAQNCTR